MNNVNKTEDWKRRGVLLVTGFKNLSVKKKVYILKIQKINSMVNAEIQPSSQYAYPILFSSFNFSSQNYTCKLYLRAFTSLYLLLVKGDRKLH